MLVGALLMTATAPAHANPPTTSARVSALAVIPLTVQPGRPQAAAQASAVKPDGAHGKIAGFGEVLAARLAEQVERALVARGLLVLGAADAQRRFEASHSEAPVQLDPATLAVLRAQVQESTRLLALNRLQEALAATQQLRELGPAAQDYLRRELSHAQELFDVCVVTAHQMAESGDVLAGSRHMLRCAQTFPGLSPVPEYHAPEVRALYDSVLDHVEQTEPATLLVRAQNEQRCVTRVNGMSWGDSPTQITTAPAAVRIQLECGDQPGRVHHYSLSPGHQTIVIDPVFDRVIHSDEARLRLQYGSGAEAAQRRLHDAAEIARTLQVNEIILVEGGEAPLLRRVTAAGREVAAVALGPAERSGPRFEQALSHLLQAGPGIGLADAPEAAAPIMEGSGGGLGAEPAVYGPGLANSARSALARAGLYVPELPILEPNQDLHWLSPLTIGIGYALSLGGSAFALSERYFVRRDRLGGVFDLDHYNDTGSLGIGFMVGGAMLATAAELLTLPERPAVPMPAWLVGGLGAAAALIGLVFVVADNACDVGDDRLACTGVHRDDLLGPLLLLQSVPLLAVPGTYLLEDVFPAEAAARIEVQGRAARVSLAGRF